jgi:hypothetical protein
MSDVEHFYYNIQAKLGGNIPWNSLDPMMQMQITQAINLLLQIASGKQV